MSIKQVLSADFRSATELWHYAAKQAGTFY